MTEESFRNWLIRYGDAWERRDPEAAKALFTDDAEYFWTPFGAPKRGPDEIATAWGEATSRQRDVRFEFTILGVSGNIGIAHWHTRLRRASGREVEIDGVLTAEFRGADRCRTFREWWHSNEHETPSRVVVIEAYQRPYENPIAIKQGDQVTIDTARATDIPGWVWCTAEDGRAGWTPARWLEPKDGAWRITRDFNAIELTVTRGDLLDVIIEESGFYWVTTPQGEFGWVPCKNVAPV